MYLLSQLVSVKWYHTTNLRDYEYLRELVSSSIAGFRSREYNPPSSTRLRYTETSVALDLLMGLYAWDFNALSEWSVKIIG